MKSDSCARVTLPALLALATLSFSQEHLSQPCPDLSAESMGCELIVWTDLQEPVPPPDPASFPAQWSEQMTFAGIIRKSEGQYFLQAGNHALALEDSSQMQGYEGEAVKVTGTLLNDNKRLRVSRIEHYF